MVHDNLVYPVPDSTIEGILERINEGIQMLMDPRYNNSQREGKGEPINDNHHE